MKIKNLVPALLMILYAVHAQAQNQHYTKLELKPKEVFIVGPGNVLLVDTLIMHDKATIKFSPSSPGTLKANVAYIGSKCTISSRGEDGLHTRKNRPGTRGSNGGDLDITMHFQELSSLLIDTQGGTGGNGLHGKNGRPGTPDRNEKRIVKGNKGVDIVTYELVPGIPGTDGKNATQGYIGGNGGNITFTYSTAAFIPVFNHANAPHSITLLHTVGDTGKDGTPGKGGFNSKDGELILEKKPQATDGQIRLVNANYTARP
ncbi:hypothetical protein H7F15_07815 [Pontibacter sp. Tf4]|uniref:hypothetical protein n=1 Tax=Pontibacter sp. Tf4 TaxID=2761620 RepID=UPI0016238336|nr:hypothetical protein [Pontibacter sp. Tf4]MBB6610938.1 hypothetical protein [Pontibacter sp. Tf4]